MILYYLIILFPICFKPFDKLTDTQKELVNKYHQKSSLRKKSIEQYYKGLRIAYIMMLLILIIVIATIIYVAIYIA